MNNGLLGLAPEQAYAFAGRISADARSMQDLVGQVTRMVTQVAWFGHNADLFRGDWEGRLSAQLVAVVEELDRTAQTLRRLADAQVQLSNNGR